MRFDDSTRLAPRSRLGRPGGAALGLLGATALLLGGALAACSSGEGSGGEGGLGHSSGVGPSGSTSSTGSGSTGVGAAGGGGAGSTSSGQGGAGGEPATTSSSGSGGSGDPCEGKGDGSYCGSDLGGLADHTSEYHCAGGVTQSVVPCSSGCSNGACVAPPSDPCGSAQFGNGAYCGGSLSGGDPNKLYDCQNGVTASAQDCPAGCQVQPPGVADNCKPVGDPCQNASSGNGLYCGQSLGNGDPNTLYDCQNQVTASSTTCTNGCQQNPPGVADACKPAQGGGCCVNAPPGVLTQSYTACGNGGSHYGMDYGTAIGTPIYAGIAGTVVGSALGFPNCYNNGCSQACWNAFNYVKIKSDCGDPGDGSHDLFVYYLHIDDLAPGIGNGSHVDQGQLVAYSGNSGCSSGPHIHIETASVPAGQSTSLSTCNSVNPASRYCN